ALPENAWLLEPIRTAPATYTVAFPTAFDHDATPALTLHFADDLVEATLGDRPLPFSANGDGSFATLPPLGRGMHALSFRTVRSDLPGKPLVWLKGAFTLQSAAPYGPGPNRTLRTAGPFTAGLAAIDPATELVAAGLPFLHQTLRAEATFMLTSPAARLAFSSVQADALHLTIDGRPHGWIWGPDWSLTLASPLAAGPHRLQVALVPSTYNHFGPHHYYNGDWHVVSPGQVVGDKNFADPDDAPARTHIPEWHFKPLRLPASVCA
ncbi:MAG: hypothetical protein RLZZ129_781, partial [Verrucomicrobiota bacterium]